MHELSERCMIIYRASNLENAREQLVKLGLTSDASTRADTIILTSP